MVLVGASVVGSRLFDIGFADAQIAMAKMRGAYMALRYPHLKQGSFDMDPMTVFLGRWTNEEKMGRQSVDGRETNVDADKVTAVRWIAAHESLVTYIQYPTDVRMASIRVTVEEALPTIWMNSLPISHRPIWRSSKGPGKASELRDGGGWY